MKYILFDVITNLLTARYDSYINGDNIPAEAMVVTDELFYQTINEQDGIWSLVDGEIVKLPFPEPTPEELMNQAVHAVKQKLQATIDEKAVALGFSNGNALMLYAGFANAFQPLAQAFASWEASVWVEAEAYKQQVIAGNKPMLSPDEAVAMMPEYITN
jgi:hypothetical protein